MGSEMDRTKVLCGEGAAGVDKTILEERCHMQQSQQQKCEKCEGGLQGSLCECSDLLPRAHPCQRCHPHYR